MPFTFAHPAIVLPFVRQKYLSATALVAGSVAPDFEYFLKMREDDVHSHTVAGLFYFDLPLVFLLSIVFHVIVRNNFIGNLPAWLQCRLNEIRNVDIIEVIRARPIAFTLSALLGAASHLFWDNFTHANGFFVESLWFYEGTIVPYNGARYPLYYALQHISTYVGMFVVALFILFKAPDRAVVPSRVSPIYWLVLFAITGGIAYARFIMYSSGSMNIGNTVVTVISAFCIGLVICGRIPFASRVAGS
jgi:hypothetical protein